MPFETMKQRGDLTIDERLDYYADDLESAAAALDVIRNELKDRDIDGQIRIVALALASIVHSLEQEADQFRTERKQEE